MKLGPYLSAVTILIALAVSCMQSSPVNQGGGGSEIEVVGHVLFLNGEPASHTQVKLIPGDYDPSTMTLPDSMIDTTDAQGCYSFFKVARGMYNIQAVQLAQRTRMLVTGVRISGDKEIIPSEQLSEPGTVKIILSSDTDGFVSIPGTDIFLPVASHDSEIVLDSVPAGTIPEIRYTVNGGYVVALRQNVLVKPSDTTTLLNFSWRLSKRIILNTSASGASVYNEVYNFPVLVRLTSDIFDFSQAKSMGEDIRFTSTNGKSLPHEIEQWDVTTRQAAIWVKVDTVHGNDSTQSIIMYWGNSAAASSSNSGAVFDTADGFQGVWHLGDASGFLDATNNRYHGFSPDSARPSTKEGMIGFCGKFNGTADYISMPQTADSKLNFSEDGYYTVSAWAFLDTFNNTSHCIVSKGYEQYYLRLTYFPTNSPSWEFVNFSASVNWQTSIFPADSKNWVLLTGVRQGNSQLLYCNGILVDSTVDNWTQGLSRNTANDLSIGRFLQPVTFPTMDGYCYFKGSIDEVRISSVVKSPDWIRLCYMNQRTDDRLLFFNQR